MAPSDRLKRKSGGFGTENDGDDSFTDLVVLDTIAEYCLNARHLADEYELATILTLLDRVLLEVGKRLSALHDDDPPIIGLNEPPAPKIDGS